MPCTQTYVTSFSPRNTNTCFVWALIEKNNNWHMFSILEVLEVRSSSTFSELNHKAYSACEDRRSFGGGSWNCWSDWKTWQAQTRSRPEREQDALKTNNFFKGLVTFQATYFDHYLTENNSTCKSLHSSRCGFETAKHLPSSRHPRAPV